MAPINIIYRCAECGEEWDDVGGDPLPHQHEAVTETYQPWGTDSEFPTWDEALLWLDT